MSIIDPKYNVLQPFVDLSYDDLISWVGFNYYTKELILNAVKNPVFIHFNQFINGRPWFINNTNNHYYEKYKEYFASSMFKEEFMLRKISILE